MLCGEMETIKSYVRSHALNIFRGNVDLRKLIETKAVTKTTYGNVNTLSLHNMFDTKIPAHVRLFKSLQQRQDIVNVPKIGDRVSFIHVLEENAQLENIFKLPNPLEYCINSIQRSKYKQQYLKIKKTTFPDMFDFLMEKEHYRETILSGINFVLNTEFETLLNENLKHQSFSILLNQFQETIFSLFFDFDHGNTAYVNPSAETGTLFDYFKKTIVPKKTFHTTNIESNPHIKENFVHIDEKSNKKENGPNNIKPHENPNKRMASFEPIHSEKKQRLIKPTGSGLAKRKTIPVQNKQTKTYNNQVKTFLCILRKTDETLAEKLLQEATNEFLDFRKNHLLVYIQQLKEMFSKNNPNKKSCLAIPEDIVEGTNEKEPKIPNFIHYILKSLFAPIFRVFGDLFTYSDYNNMFGNLSMRHFDYGYLKLMEKKKASILFEKTKNQCVVCSKEKPNDNKIAEPNDNKIADFKSNFNLMDSIKLESYLCESCIKTQKHELEQEFKNIHTHELEYLKVCNVCKLSGDSCANNIECLNYFTRYQNSLRFKSIFY